MNVLEKEIEDMIWQGLVENRALLRNKGLHVWEKASYHRQVDFGSYGICDIIGVHIAPKRNGERVVNAHIIEIKKEQINISTFLQSLRYAKAVKRIVEENLNNTACYCGITLIGKTVEIESEFIYLPDIMDNVALYTYKLDFRTGIYFQKENGYQIANEKILNPKEYNWALISMLTEQIKGKRKEEELPF